MQKETEMLIAKAKQGDKSAIWELYQENKGLLYRVCAPFVNSRYPEDDIMQEAYFPFLRAIEVFDPMKAELSTYIANAVRWYFSNMHKRDKNRKDLLILDKPLEEGEGDTLGDLIEDESANFEERLTDAEAKRSIFPIAEEILNGYQERNGSKNTDFSYYEVIRKYYQEGKPYAQIAEESGVPEKTAMQRGESALRVLRHPRWKKIQAFRQEYIAQSYSKVSFAFFRERQTTSVEWAVMKTIEREEKELGKARQKPLPVLE